ncbi:DsbA family protein, partial [Rhizobium ruizarguesonis]
GAVCGSAARTDLAGGRWATIVPTGTEKAMDVLMATPASLSEEDVKRLLTSAGLDLGKIAAAVRQNDKKISNLLTRNYDQALAFNFGGTPSFVIGKTAYSGVLSKDQLRDLIKQARAA